MARIFISYSRADVLFVEELVPLLQSVYPRHQIWYDQRISGGEDWWQMILGEIHACDIFLYLMSNDSLTSEYCQAEFTEALRLQKACVPVIIRPKTTIENAPQALLPEIKRRNWVDLSSGFKDAKANARLYSSINKYIDALPPTPPPPLSPHPIAQPQITMQTNTQVSIPKSVIFPIVVLLILIVLVAIVALINSQNQNNQSSTPQPTNTPQSVAVVTDAPTPDLGAFLAGTQTREVQLTDLARPTATPTLTPNYDATLNAMASQTVAARPTNTPTNTPQPTATLSPEQVALTPVTRNEDWTPIEREFDGVTMVLVPAGCFMMGSTNAQIEEAYQAYVEQFAESTAVPDESPQHEQCFDQPFWIDKYEVSQAQFEQFGGQKANANAFTGDNLPVEQITWFEARDYCENNRGGRLPTEHEWEYVARGPNNLIYPWGNEFDGTRLNFCDENCEYDWRDATADDGYANTAPVGSYLGGASWVGAMDMSGNVWEWVSSLSADYPYTPDNESVNDNNSARVLRGGSWDGSGVFVRSAYRFWLFPTGEYVVKGFRCVRPQD